MAAIPAIIAGVTAAGIGIAQAASRAKKTKFEKKNLEEIERLQRLQQSGGLGLSPAEQRVREAQLISPVRAAAEAERTRSEQLLAAQGGTSGADISRLRQERTRAVGAAGQAANLALQQEDVQRRQGQIAELEQRRASASASQQARRAGVFGGLSQAAAGAGQVAGALPETFRAAGVAGAPIRDPSAFRAELQAQNISPETQAILLRIPSQNLTRTLQDSAAGSGRFFSAELQAALEREAATRGGTQANQAQVDEFARFLPDRFPQTPLQ